jgi:hypothetical protein
MQAVRDDGVLLNLRILNIDDEQGHGGQNFHVLFAFFRRW